MGELTSKAWVVDIGHGHHISLGLYELIHFIVVNYENKLIVEGNRQSINWNKNKIPVLNIMEYLMNIKNQENREGIKYVSIVAFEKDKKVCLGGIVSNDTPKLINVSDDQVCDYPDDMSWDSISETCYLDKKYGKVPIINLHNIFTSVVK